MKIIYIGQINEGGTCFDRMRSLQRLGYDIHGFNVSFYESKIRILRSLRSRLKPRILLQKMNEDIVRFVQDNSPIDMVWVDKGVMVFHETLMEIKRVSDAVLIHYTPDPQMLFHKSRHFFSCIKAYDILVTTKSFEIESYKMHGAKKVILSQQAYCPVRYRNPVLSRQYQCEVGFIGHYEKHYANCLYGLKNEGIRLQVYGINWNKNAWKYPGISDSLRLNGLWGEDYVNALASFRISLGLLSKYIPEQHTTRTFEIPAAGSFLLAERTDEHLSFFEEGVEAEFFSSTDELVDKAKFYLANSEVREKIARAGLKRCLTSGYDNDSVMKRILGEINA